MRICCRECQRKMEIDEGFAGSVCRCPFCQALLYVPQSKQEEPCTVRPAAPAPRRPHEGVAPSQAGTGATWPKERMDPASADWGDRIVVPMATPVKTRKWLWMVGLALGLALLAGIAVVLWR